jgi:hypothetical protein
MINRNIILGGTKKTLLKWVFEPSLIVTRVAAGAGENCGLGAGQILDINTDGQVQVWWADQEDTQTTGLCYPQDIYKVQLIIYIF